MRLFANSRPITMSSAQWVVSAALILAVLPAIVGLAFLPQICVVYTRTFELPKWEKTFGFTHGTIPVSLDGHKYEMFGIATVIPDGTFAKAGVPSRVGVAGFREGFEPGFYGQMEQLERGGTVTLELISEKGQRSSVVLRPESSR
jgi:hypothetical protein